MDRSEAIRAVCLAIERQATDEAASILKRDYPFAPEPTVQRKYGVVEATRVFVRDGFIDRYTGEPLIFPPVLRLLSIALPTDFPYHPNWKTSVTHPAYWEVGVTIDHVIPVSRGGVDDESNWVTTSMARNSAKMNWTLAELGWSLRPPGTSDWNGMMTWFLSYTASHPAALGNSSVRQWHRAARMMTS